jgi:hypothetical protein
LLDSSLKALLPVSGLLLLLVLVVPVYAPTAVESLTFGLKNPGPQGTVFPAGANVLIENSVNLSAASPGGMPANDSLLWIAVARNSGPTGLVFVSSGRSNITSFSGGSNGGNATCNVPFGATGQLEVTGQNGTISLAGCTGSNNNWYPVTEVVNSTTFLYECGHNIRPDHGGSGGVGNTTVAGTYQVYACWSQNGGSIVNRSFIIQPASSLQTLSIPFTLLLTTGLILARNVRKPRH